MELSHLCAWTASVLQMLLGTVCCLRSVVNFYSLEKYPNRMFGYLNVGYLEGLIFVPPFSSFAKIQEYRRKIWKENHFLTSEDHQITYFGWDVGSLITNPCELSLGQVISVWINYPVETRPRLLVGKGKAVEGWRQLSMSCSLLFSAQHDVVMIIYIRQS